jgi:hypothetical protein
MSKRIYLTQGKFTIVSDEDYERLIRFKWCYNKYAVTTIRIEGKPACRAVHQMILVAPPGLEIDHINRNKLDNRRCNLRIVTHSENMKNKAPRPRKPTPLRKPKVGRSGVLGVTWRSKRQMWIASYQKNKHRAYLGAYSTVQEAAAVLIAYKLRLAMEREKPTTTIGQGTEEMRTEP